MKPLKNKTPMRIKAVPARCPDQDAGRVRGMEANSGPAGFSPRRRWVLEFRMDACWVQAAVTFLPNDATADDAIKALT